MEKKASYVTAESLQIGKKRTAAEAGFSETTQGTTPGVTVGKKNHRHHFYHHVEPECSCGGVRYKKKSKKKHSVQKGLESKDLKRCHYEKDGKCDHCSAARGKLDWDPYIGTHYWDLLFGTYSGWDPILGPYIGTLFSWDPFSVTHNLNVFL